MFFQESLKDLWVLCFYQRNAFCHVEKHGFIRKSIYEERKILFFVDPKDGVALFGIR